jgi:uncharacterized protein with HEPN domain
MPVKSSPSDDVHLQEKYLADMLESARAIQQYMEGVSFDGFRDDARTRDAVTYRINVIGEAARHVTNVTASALPGIPFNKIRGMRNRIAHEYDRINYRQVWEVTQDHIAPLIAALEGYFALHPIPAPVETEIDRIRAHSKTAIKKATPADSPPRPETPGMG